VKLFKDTTLLKTFMQDEYEFPVDGVTILQEYIESPDNCVIRCEYVGGKFLYALRINATESFENCPSDVCQMPKGFKQRFEIVQDFEDPIIEVYKNFLNTNRIDISGVEFIKDKDNTVSFASIKWRQNLQYNRYFIV
jgi:hypothetical protein